MADFAAVINKTIEQHHDIKGHLKLAGDSLTDIEAQFILDKAYSGWSQSSVRQLEEKLNAMIRAVSALTEGLKRHFGFEEKSLPALLSEADMKIIIYDHQKIARQLENAAKVLRETKLEGLNQQELLQKKTAIQEIIRSLMQTVEEHAKHEEIILNAVKNTGKATPA
jgi:hemerythrin